MSTWRQQLTAKHGREAERQLRALGDDVLDDDAHETIIRQQWFEAAKEFSPDASLREELQVRLSGETIETGSLSFKVGEALLKPLEDGISTAAKRDLDLEIVGLSAGSTILHVQATPTSLHDDNADRMPETGSSPADMAMRSFIRLVDAAESGKELYEWPSAQWPLYRLVEALDRFDVTLGLRWLSRTGTVRSSRLTSQGRRYVRALHDLREEESNQIVRGRITELREAGIVKVKTGTSRTAPAYDVRVQKDALIGMHLELGQQVAFRVQVIARYDRLGNEHSREYYFMGVIDTKTSKMF
jgi:hypothetical protein